MSDLAVDKRDNVMVVDCNNRRVEVLSRTLTHLGFIDIPGHDLYQPNTLYLDEVNRRLYIGEGLRSNGGVFVLGADVNEQN